MIRNILFSVWASVRRRKLFTILTILAIGSAMTLLYALCIAFDTSVGNHPPEIHKNRTLYLRGLRIPKDNSLGKRTLVTTTFAEHYLPQLRSIESFALYKQFTCNLESMFHPKKAYAYGTDFRFWQILEFNFLEGKSFSKAEFDNGRKVVVIAEHTAMKYYGTIKVIGKKLKGFSDFTIIGVVKSGSSNQLASQDLWFPYSSIEHDNRFKSLPMQYYLKTDGKSCLGIILVKSDVSLSQAKLEFEQLLGKLSKTESIVGMPGTTRLTGSMKDRFEQLIPKQDDFILTTIFTILILLIPVTTIIFLNNSQITERYEEIGVRKAFGATRKKVIQQYLMENTIITLVGGLLGILFAYLSILTMWNIHEQNSLTRTFPFNGMILLYCFILCLLLSVITGIITAGRLSKVHPVTALKGGTL
ncbi:FtsX-like permease family protein [Puteibacter caeruleilacunae]|nr:FtsX-like permease family protein [Puteibacter caeruleilacunae]